MQVNRETLLLYHSCVIIDDILADTESGRTEPKKKIQGGKIGSRVSFPTLLLFPVACFKVSNLLPQLFLIACWRKTEKHSITRTY